LHYREEQAIATEDHVADARDRGDLEADRRLEGANVAGMHAEDLTRCKILDDELTAQLKPRSSLPAKALQQESVATKDACAKRLLKSNADGNLRGGA
jgi:hypothetical protein